MPGRHYQLRIERLEVSQVRREVRLVDRRHLHPQLHAVEGAELLLGGGAEGLAPAVVGDDGADPVRPSSANWAIGPATIGAAGRQVRKV